MLFACCKFAYMFAVTVFVVVVVRFNLFDDRIKMGQIDIFLMCLYDSELNWNSTNSNVRQTFSLVECDLFSFVDMGKNVQFISWWTSKSMWISNDTNCRSCRTSVPYKRNKKLLNGVLVLVPFIESSVLFIRLLLFKIRFDRILDRLSGRTENKNNQGREMVEKRKRA